VRKGAPFAMRMEPSRVRAADAAAAPRALPLAACGAPKRILDV
jgi:hypothetical protein